MTHQQEAATIKPNTSETSVSLSTVQSEVGRLYHLLDATADILMEMNYERDGKRDVELDRVAALVFIARDNVQRVSQTIDDNFYAIEGGTRK
ncbi:hypothetical protein [Methylocystis parvus]|uniref:Uncharacterized protein n=1 Tax=Methylocystis parvus TaxID=134 RepID=A0A6B8MBE3_9HYPH|nr:hypothetical protein [Methylocystis parvus]QGM99958.1 hypothetical protein F7D14_20455 [Methylocystis parvus]WBK02187.1 hypothetical protein MMG94_20300 [Methylocystis parvus OBBP]